MLTIKDLKDLAMIYKDCDDYKITVWDANQQKRYKLVFTGSSRTDKTMSFNLVEDALSDKEQYQIDLLNKLITLNRQIRILKEEYNKTNAEYESQKNT